MAGPDDFKRIVDEMLEKMSQGMEPDIDLQGIYGLRAEIRNGLRSFFEKNVLTAYYLKLPYLPDVFVEDIEKEEKGKVMDEAERKVESGDCFFLEEAVKEVRVDAYLCLSRGDIEIEEKVRYIIDKITFYLREDNFEKARNIYERALKGSKNDPVVLDLLREEAGKLVVEYFLHLVGKERYQTAVDAFYELGIIKEIEEKDLGGVEFNEQERAWLFRYFPGKLKSALKVHPFAYVAVRDSLNSLGLYPGAGFEGMIGAKEEMIRALRDVLDKHPAIYVGLLGDYVKSGIVESTGFNAAEELKDDMIVSLSRWLVLSPQIYFEMRDKYVELGLLEEEEVDESEWVKQALYRLLKMVVDTHATIYTWFKYKMKFGGLYLLEEDEKALDEECDKSMELIDRLAVGWAVGLHEDEGMAAKNKVTKLFDHNYDQWAKDFGKNDEYYRSDFARKVEESVRKFIKKYPQYKGSVRDHNLIERS